MIEDLEKALAWLSNLGVATEKTRYASYLRTLKLIDKRWREGAQRAKDIPVDPQLMETSALEASQLVRIHEGLAVSPPDGLAAKLGLLVDGPLLETNERSANAGNAARDCAFELELASYFRRAGEVELGQGVDLTVRFRGIPLFIECKRPSSRKRITSNLDRASQQVRERLGQTALASYGIPAISVSKSHWNGWPLVRGESMESIRATMTDKIAEFDRQHVAPWFARQRDGRLIAVLIHFPYIAYAGDSPTILGTEIFVIGSRFILGTRAHQDLAELIAALGIA